jgi:Leucine-rich repeat (LRR) protein
MRHPTIRLVLTSVAILLAALGAVLGTGNVAQTAGTFLDATDNLKISATRHYAVKPGNPMTPATIDEHFTFSVDNDDDGSTSNISARPQTASTSTVVTFPDSNLEGAIRSALSKPTGDIIPDDMTILTKLWANGRGIQDLTGIEHATNLTTLNLYNNQISDISAIAFLTNLTTLYLNSNQISDISAIASLTNLTRLDLRGNQISDISAIDSLNNLTLLYLGGNQISDISAIASLTHLVTLYLYSNQISDISGIASLTNGTVIWIGLSDNQISDISAIASFIHLTWLDLGSNQISDISGIASLTNLTVLDLGSNQISDISAIASLTHLTWLILSGNQISDISALVANVGISSGNMVNIQNNPLSQEAYGTFIPQLQARGVDVRFTPSPTAVPALAPLALVGLTVALVFFVLSYRRRTAVQPLSQHQ